MKTLKTITNKILLATGIVLGIIIITTTISNAEPIANKNDSTKTKEKSIEMVEMEVLELLENESDEILAELNLIQEPTIKIYDNNDVLIYAGNDEEGMDASVKVLLHQSDVIMRQNQTTYYKLNQ